MSCHTLLPLCIPELSPVKCHCPMLFSVSAPIWYGASWTLTPAVTYSLNLSERDLKEPQCSKSQGFIWNWALERMTQTTYKWVKVSPSRSLAGKGSRTRSSDVMHELQTCMFWGKGLMEVFKRAVIQRHLNLVLCDTSRAAYVIDVSKLIATWAHIRVHMVIIRKPEDRASNLGIMIALKLVLGFSLLVYDLTLTLLYSFWSEFLKHNTVTLSERVLLSSVGSYLALTLLRGLEVGAPFYVRVGTTLNCIHVENDNGTESIVLGKLSVLK